LSSQFLNGVFTRAFVHELNMVPNGILSALDENKTLGQHSNVMLVVHNLFFVFAYLSPTYAPFGQKDGLSVQCSQCATLRSVHVDRAPSNVDCIVRKCSARQPVDFAGTLTSRCNFVSQVYLNNVEIFKTFPGWSPDPVRRAPNAPEWLMARFITQDARRVADAAEAASKAAAAAMKVADATKKSLGTANSGANTPVAKVSGRTSKPKPRKRKATDDRMDIEE
jgi:hypothetical protein